MRDYIHVNPTTQTLHFNKTYTISTALNGLGEVYGSEKTPQGWHQIRAKIGNNLPINSVIVARRPTGEIFTSDLESQDPNRDWILSRILWLSGLESFNSNTMRRYIYLHGSPDNSKFGTPNSHGCIRMRNSDIIDLFSKVETGLKVFVGDKLTKLEG